MAEQSVLQRVRDAAAQRQMSFSEYLRYADQANNDLSPDEQWDAMNVKMALRRDMRRVYKK